jgi:replication factor C subunit 2/4
MWIFKHKPPLLDDIVDHHDVLKKIKDMIQKKTFQHMILCGPPGVGKTCIVDAMANQLLGEDKKKQALFFSYSCDDRGINVIREKLHGFVPKKVTLPQGVPKLLVFKMAEKISEGAQQQMRRLMEQHSHSCVFIFLCTELTGIIETIQSRCCIMRLNPVGQESQLRVLHKICTIEAINPQEDALSLLIQLSKGDLRYSINHLEVCVLLNDKKVLTVEAVKKVCIFPYFDILEGMIEDVVEGKVHAMVAAIERLYGEGLNGVDILLLFADTVMASPLFDRAKKLRIIRQVGVAHRRIATAVDSRLFLFDMLSSI